MLVREALQALSGVEVLLLSESEGLSPAEIAAVLGCRGVTARSRLHRRGAAFATPSSV